MCIKGLRLVTMQLPEKFSPIGAGPTELRHNGVLRSSRITPPRNVCRNAQEAVVL